MSISAVSYSGQWLIPAPLISITKNYSVLGNQKKVGALYTFNVVGVISNDHGSPNSAGTFSTNGSDLTAENIDADDKLAILLRKQTAIRNLFANDGQKFQIRSPSNLSGIYFYPKIKQIEFPEDIFFNISRYNIQMEADVVYGLNDSPDQDFSYNEMIQSANESWAFEQGEVPNTYNLVHTLAAQGKTQYYSSGSSSAYQNAKSFVENQLKLNYTTSSTFSPLTGTDFTSNSNMNISGYNQYNYYRTENNNETDGSYEVVENWILSTGNFLETYTVSLNQLYESDQRAVEGQIQGTVIGLHSNLHDFRTRYTNALAGWNSYVKGQTYPRISGIALGYTLNSIPSLANVDHDPINGRISYSYGYDDRPAGISGVRDIFSVERRMSLEDYRIIVTIQGNLICHSSGDVASRFANSEYVFYRLKNSGDFYNRAVQYSKTSGLQSTPFSHTYTAEPTVGSITYNFEYSNRSPNSVMEEYTVDKRYSREDGVTQVDVAGQIVGYATNIYDDGVTGTDTIGQKYANASSYWTTVSGLLYERALTYGSNLITYLPVTKVEGHNPLAGIITYNYTFNSVPLPLISGALSEILTINYISPGEVYAALGIPGRSAGPITQNINTITSRQQTISLEVLMPIPTGSTYAIRLTQKPSVWDLVSGIEPSSTDVFRGEPNESWSPTTGRYTFQRSYFYKS